MQNGNTKKNKKPGFPLVSNQRVHHDAQSRKVAGSPAGISKIAKCVSSWEYDKEYENPTSKNASIYTAMQQTHSPAMEDTVVTEYDGTRAKPTEKEKEVELHMDIAPEGSLSWGYYCVGLSNISGLMLAGAWFGIYSESVLRVFWAFLILAVFGAPSAYHAYRSEKMRIGGSENTPEEW